MMQLKKLWVFIMAFNLTAVFAGQRVAFVTSVSGNGDLSTWADAGSNTGLAAGDVICQARADAAGLSNADNFIALLSDSNDDVYCRLTGFSGKKADMCGQASLPTDAGPWVNILGENFAAALPEMLNPNHQVYRPLNYDEFGDTVNSRYYSGSRSDGELSSVTMACDDWTISTSGKILGTTASSFTSGSGIFSVGSNSCSFNLRLACFETVAGDPLVPESPSGSLAFVTNEAGDGDLSSWPSTGGEVGIDAADQICQTAAMGAGLPEPEAFIAWISDDSVDAIDRFEYNGPWFRQDGVIIAHSLTELTSGQLNAPNNLTENMTYLTNRAVWTGTDAFGIGAPENCQNWQSNNENETGINGSAYHTTSFSDQFNTGCNFRLAHLYCFHNKALDLIFKMAWNKSIKFYFQFSSDLILQQSINLFIIGR